MVQIDEKTHRLFVVTRKPARFIVLDSDSGATQATFGAPSSRMSSRAPP